jgi:hypothetical protein
MLELTMIEPGGILRVKPSGALTAGDFATLSRFADEYLEKNGSLAGLLIEAESFPGWDSFAGLAAHIRFVRDHQRHIQRIALVSDSSVAHVAEILADPFVAADIRWFRFNQYDAALHWLRTDRRTAVNVLVVLTSHESWAAPGARPDFGWKNWRRRTTCSRTRAPR